MRDCLAWDVRCIYLFIYYKRRYRKRRTPKGGRPASVSPEMPAPQIAMLGVAPAPKAVCGGWRPQGAAASATGAAAHAATRGAPRSTRSRRGAYCSQCRAVGGCGGGQHGPAGQALFAVGGCTLMHDEGKCLRASARCSAESRHPCWHDALALALR